MIKMSMIELANGERESVWASEWKTSFPSHELLLKFPQTKRIPLITEAQEEAQHS